MRHAKSEENEKVYRCCEGLIDLKEGRVASGLGRLSGVASFLNSTLDSPLCDMGRRQVADMRLILRSARFWEGLLPNDLILHSSLQRAKDTLYGTLPHPSARHGMVIRELEDLREATPYEHVDSRSLMTRVSNFEKTLMSEEYDKHRTLVVCGHSQYFKKMLKMKMRMNNVDVWEVSFNFDPNDRQHCVWGEPKLLHRTELADVHPWDVFMGNSARDSNQERTDEEDKKDDEIPSGGRQEEDEAVINDLQTDGVEHITRVCRICTMTEEEMPEHALIRPCNCKGTQEFVHIDCLNRWRATSNAASEVCPVCKYKYRIQKGWLATLLLSEIGALIITALLVLTLCLASGALLVALLPKEWLPSIVLGKYVSMQREARWWDHCSPKQYLNYSQWLKVLHQSENRAPLTLMDYVSALIYGYGGLLANSKAMCNKTMQTLMNIVAEGSCATAGTQLVLFVFKNAKVAIENAPNDRPAVQEARLRLLNVAFLCAPLLESSPFSGARTANLRLVFILGFLLIVKDLGGEFRERGRALASSLGEVIMERDR